MRAAIFSDIHGDVRALETLLADVASFGVDEHWVLGDLVAHGPRPAEVLSLLRPLPGLRVVRGNTDRYALTGDLSPWIRPGDSSTRESASRALGWTLGVVAAGGHRDWLAGLPLDARLTLPSGDRVLLVHASPGTDDGPGLYREMTDAQMRAAGVVDAGAELLLTGHTHVAMDRVVDGVRVANTGSVGNPVGAVRRSTWALLEANEGGYALELRSCPFDSDGLFEDLESSGFPAADWLRRRLAR